jgi:hypothetical protein
MRHGARTRNKRARPPPECADQGRHRKPRRRNSAQRAIRTARAGGAAARHAPRRRFIGGADPRALGYREAAKLGYTLGTDRGAETPGPVCPVEYP